jgi:hypothetical protein
MAPRVRAAEVREIKASHGLDAEQMLIGELADSDAAWTWLVDGVPACMFGVMTMPVLLGGESFPWFFSTELVNKHARQFARTCKELLPELLAHHPRLVGRVDARYALSIRWLRWLGAEIGEAAPYGVEQLPFHSFVIGK